MGFALRTAWEAVSEPLAIPEGEKSQEQIAPFPKKLPGPSSEQRRRVITSFSDPVQIEKLMALGYVEGTYDPDIDLRGVLIHDRDKAFQGLNFYYSDGASSAQLIDMDGKPAYRWEHELGP